MRNLRWMTWKEGVMRRMLVVAAATAAALGLAMPAQSALVASGITSVTDVPSDNDFASDLAGLTLTKMAFGYSIGVVGAPVNISVFRVAAESGDNNWVEINGTNYPEGNDAWDLGDLLITYSQASDGPLSGNISFNSISGLGSPAVALFVPDGVGSNTGDEYISSSLFFGFNDAGSPDGDFDDYIIRITSVDIRSNAVPEPHTWLMLILGFGMIGASIRYGRKNVIPTAA
ncbi:MAG: PEPxxWA-CTERM sorting domain-containing protein [Sphingomonas sp.]|nr:PEPxxWA-CTERM sorting domain-containing protein [Sphingomonas sp.]